MSLGKTLNVTIPFSGGAARYFSTTYGCQLLDRYVNWAMHRCILRRDTYCQYSQKEAKQSTCLIKNTLRMIPKIKSPPMIMSIRGNTGSSFGKYWENNWVLLIEIIYSKVGIVLSFLARFNIPLTNLHRIVLPSNIRYSFCSVGLHSPNSCSASWQKLRLWVAPASRARETSPYLQAHLQGVQLESQVRLAQKSLHPPLQGLAFPCFVCDFKCEFDSVVTERELDLRLTS